MSFDLLAWHWLAAGLVLAVLEIFVSGGVLIWIALPLLTVGLVLLAFPDLSLAGQLGIFALCATASLSGALLVRSRRKGARRVPVNVGSERFIGRSAILETPITAGRGEVRLDDTIWLVSGPDLPAGSEVVVTGADGAILKVRRKL